MVDVHFQHWFHTLSDETLVRYGSPHFDSKTAGRALSEIAKSRATLQSEHRTSFDLAHILCANEAFPEAAVTDPLADLEVWDEWRSGIRVFPYPGRYGPLGIRRQEAKTQSPSSVGVLGEIMAGLYSQAGIAPWVLVRVIRRWPDYIFYTGHGRYAFVEAKAFTEASSNGRTLGDRVPEALLGECLINGVYQVNADPDVQVWGAFTGIASITPMPLVVTFLELDVDPSRRTSVGVRVLPEPVVSGLSERAISRALSKLPEWEVAPLKKKRRGRKSGQRKMLEVRISSLAEEELEGLLENAGPRPAIAASRSRLSEEISRLLAESVVAEKVEGRRFFEAKQRASEGILSHIRTAGGRSLMIADLDDQERMSISAEWTSNWESASSPWGIVDGVPVWRCGGSVFALGERTADGRRIR